MARPTYKGVSYRYDIEFGVILFVEDSIVAFCLMTRYGLPSLR